jgi:hypothetical protein
VKIATGKSGVVLPNGGTYKDADVVTLKDEEFARIPPSLIPGTIIDEGVIRDFGGAAVHVATGKNAVVLPSGQTVNSTGKAYLTPEQMTLLKTTLIPTYVVNDDDKLAFIEEEVALTDLASRSVSDAVTNSTKVVTSASAAFTAADVGKFIAASAGRRHRRCRCSSTARRSPAAHWPSPAPQPRPRARPSHRAPSRPPTCSRAPG